MRRWIERQRGLADYAVAHMARRRGRNLGLFLAYVLLVFLLASVVLYGDALRREARALLADAPELVVQKLSAGRHDLLPESWLEQARGLRGVQGVEGRLWGYHYDAAMAANLTLQSRDDIPRGEARIGPALARARGLGAGDLLSLRDHRGQPFAFRINGLLDSRAELANADLLLVHPADLRAFFGIAPGLHTDLALRVANPREVRRVAEKLLERLPQARVISRDEMRRTYEAAFHWRQGVLLAFLSCVLLAFAFLAWDRASGLTAEERREIGILKALGWDTGDVLRMKFWEGGLLSFTAFCVGYFLAWLHVFHAEAPLFTAVMKGWSVLYPHFQLRPEADVGQVAALALLTVLPFVAATLIPVWRAATLDPDEVMRE